MNIDTISNDMKEAMKSGNKFDLTVLRMLKSALQKEKIAKNHELEEAEVIAVVKKEVKTRKDSILFKRFNPFFQIFNIWFRV